MVRRKTPFVVALLLLLLFGGHADAQTKTALPRSVPEAEGVSSEGILNFLEAAAKSKHEWHSFMLLRHGKVVAEGWWDPYRPELKHTMYSVSKSFTSTAVGFAAAEKLLSVNDKVVAFFPDDVPERVSPYLSELTVKDLLSMSAGQDPDPTLAGVTSDHWVKTFLATPVVNQPGTKLLYNSLATYMLSAIVQKATGQKIIDYLTPRLFEPLGIRGMDWEVDPRGVNTGGWGLRIKTEDMAKFGQLYLQKGNWKGKQILPQEWAAEATTARLEQGPAWVPAQTKKESSDWLQGYGYQFWRCRHNAFRADGAFGQFIIVLPEQDAVVVLTAETPDMQDEINLVWKHLLPAMREGQLPANKNVAAALKEKLSSLALSPPAKTAASPIATRIAGKTFVIEPNEKQLETVSFRFQDETCRVALKIGPDVHQLAFGPGAWLMGETSKRGPYLLARANAYFAGLPPAKVAGSYRWRDENTLELTLRYVESPHTETIICRFDQNKITVDMQNSIETGPQSKKPVLKGATRG